MTAVLFVILYHFSLLKSRENMPIFTVYFQRTFVHLKDTFLPKTY